MRTQATLNVMDYSLFGTAIDGLSAKQVALALSTQNLSQAQLEEIVIKNDLLAKYGAEELIKNGLLSVNSSLLASEKTVNAVELEKRLIKSGVNKEEAKELIQSNLKIVANGKETSSEVVLTKAIFDDLVARELLANEKAEEILQSFGVVSGDMAEYASKKALTTAIWELVSAQAAALATNPVTWIVGGLVALVGVLDLVTTSTKEYEEELNNLRDNLETVKSECSDLESELKSCNDELKTTQDRMKELENIESPTFAEKEEYENLVATNNELERKIALLELEQKTKNAEKNKAFIDTMQKDVFDGEEYWVDNDTGIIEKGDSMWAQIGGIYASDSTEADYIEQKFATRQRLLDRLSEAETKEEKDRIQSQIDEIDSYLQDKSSEWNKDSEGISYISNPTSEDDKKVNEWLDYIADFQDRMAIAMSSGDADTNAKHKDLTFNRVVDNWQFDETVQGLQDLGKEGKVTADMLADPKYDEFIDKLVFLGVINSADNLEDIALAFNSVAISAEKATDSAGNFSDEIPVQWTLSEDQSKAIDDFHSKISTLSTALESELSGALTSADLSKLLQEFPELEGQTDNLINALRELINGELSTLLSLLGSDAPDDLVQSLKGSADEAVNFAGNVDKLQGELSYLEKILSDVRSQKSLDISTMSDLINRYGDLDEAVIELADGGYSIEEDKLIDLMNTKIEESNAAISAQIEMTKTVIEEIEKRLKAYKAEQDALKTSNERLASLMNEGKVGTAISEFGSDAVLEWEMLEDNISYEEKQLNASLSELQELKEQYKENTDLKNILGSSSSSSSSSNNIIDWIETFISRIQRSITNLGKVVSATYRDWSTRNNALAKEMSEVNQEIGVQQKAYEEYMKAANSVPLAESYKELVRSGAYFIEPSDNEELNEKIDLYRQWYEKALDCADAIEDLRAELADLARTKFDNVSKQYDDLISNTTHYVSMLEGYVDQSEAAGYMVSEAYYKAMADKQEENIVQLQSKYSSLIASWNEATQNGSIQKYSEEWYSMWQDINDVEEELQSATTQLIEFNQTLQQLSWDAFDRIRDYVNNIVTEAEFLIDVLDGYDLHTDKGVITDEGLAVQGLHAVNYNTYMEQSIAYAEELAKIEEEMANDPYDLELIDRCNELLELQQEAISNAMSEKEAIVDLISDGYDKMLESLNNLINKRKEALQAEKDLYSYQNSIEEKTSNIASLKKQIKVYEKDNSESAKATIQKLQVSLSEAEKDLEQTEYEKYISDQEQMLDTLYDQTEQYVNERLDNIDGLIAEAVEATNKNAETISSAIHEASNAYGYKLSDQMETIWDYEENAIDGVVTIVSVYGDVIHGVGMDLINSNSNIASAINGGTTNVITAIGTLNVAMENMITSLDKIATANANSITSAQTAVANGQASVSQNSSVTNVTSSSSNGGDSSNNGNGNSVGSSTNSNSVPQKSIIYNVKLRSTGALLKTGTASECESWINSNSLYERDGNVTDGTYWVKAKEKKYTLLDKQENVIASGLTKAQAQGRMNAQGNALGWKMVAYASGTTDAKKGLAIIGEDGAEIVIDKNGNAMLTLAPQLLTLSGGETILNNKDTLNAMSNNLMPLSAEQLWGNIVKTPNLPVMSNNVGGTVTNYNQFSFDLPNVVDANSLINELQHNKRFEKIIDSMTADKMMGKNTLNKYRY